MVICPCGVMGPANGAVGRRPSQMPSDRNKTVESFSSNSKNKISHGLCGSATTSDENSNTAIDMPKSTVTSQPQSHPEFSSEETTLKPSSLLAKLPQIASNSTKKLSSLPVPLPRLGFDDPEDKPKIEEKVSTSLVLSDNCGKYVGTKPVRSNILSLQPVYKNPNRHLAEISSIPITHYDFESGISIYVNPNKSVEYKIENSLTYQERSKRYASQRSLNDQDVSTSSMDQHGLKSNGYVDCRVNARSECGKRPIPQPRHIKEDPSEQTSKSRRTECKKYISNIQTHNSKANSGSKKSIKDKNMKGSKKFGKPLEMKEDQQKKEIPIQERNKPNPKSHIVQEVDGALVWVADSLKYNAIQRAPKQKTKSKCTLFGMKKEKEISKIQDSSGKNNKKETILSSFQIKSKKKKLSSKPVNNIPTVHTDTKMNKDIINEQNNRKQNELPSKSTEGTNAEESPNRKRRLKKRKTKLSNLLIKPPNTVCNRQQSYEYNCEKEIISNTIPISCAMINDDSLSLTANYSQVTTSPSILNREDLAEFPMEDFQHYYAELDEVRMSISNTSDATLISPLYPPNSIISDLCWSSSSLQQSFSSTSTASTNTSFSSPMLSSISSVPSPYELANPWKYPKPDITENRSRNSPVLRRNKSIDSPGVQNKRGSLTFYPVYSNCEAPRAQNCHEDVNHYSDISKRASLCSLPIDLRSSREDGDWKHWSPLFSDKSSYISPDEGFEASSDFSGTLPRFRKHEISNTSKNYNSMDRQKSSSCSNFFTESNTDTFNSIEVDCKVPSMKALDKPLVYEYRSRENLRQLNRLSQGSDLSDYLELDVFENSPHKKNLSSALQPKHINLFETYWDYWLAKNKLSNMINGVSQINAQKDRFKVPTAAIRRCSYDPEILLAQVDCPKVLEDTSFYQYSSKVKSSIMGKLGKSNDTHNKHNNSYQASCFQNGTKKEEGYFSEPEFQKSNNQFHGRYNRTDSYDDGLGSTQSLNTQHLPYISPKSIYHDEYEDQDSLSSQYDYGYEMHNSQAIERRSLKTEEHIRNPNRALQISHNLAHPSIRHQNNIPQFLPHNQIISKGIAETNRLTEMMSSSETIKKEFGRFPSFIWRQKKIGPPSPKIILSSRPKLEKIYERSTKIPTPKTKPYEAGKSQTSLKNKPKFESTVVKDNNRKSFLPVFRSHPLNENPLPISSSNLSSPSISKKTSNNLKQTTKNSKPLLNNSPKKSKTNSSVSKSISSLLPRTFTSSSSKSSSSSSSSKSASSGDSITTVVPAIKRQPVKNNSNWLLTKFRGTTAVV